MMHKTLGVLKGIVLNRINVSQLDTQKFCRTRVFCSSILQFITGMCVFSMMVYELI